jgi:hypothetical protein
MQQLILWVGNTIKWVIELYWLSNLIALVISSTFKIFNIPVRAKEPSSVRGGSSTRGRDGSLSLIGLRNNLAPGNAM